MKFPRFLTRGAPHNVSLHKAVVHRSVSRSSFFPGRRHWEEIPVVLAIEMQAAPTSELVQAPIEQFGEPAELRRFVQPFTDPELFNGMAFGEAGKWIPWSTRILEG